MKSYILLENAVFYAYHGVFEQENKVGNTYVVNVKIKVDISASADSDELSDTVSYADVYNIVAEEMKIPSKLLEHATKRIFNRLIKECNQIEEVEVKVSKKNPPLGGEVESASILLIG